MSVSHELHAAVLRRDGMCFLARLSTTHVCHDQWGQWHPITDLSKLTVDHVHETPGGVRGKRAPDDERHLIAMCAQSNIAGPSKAVREAERSYLKSLYAETAEPVKKPEFRIGTTQTVHKGFTA